MNQTWDAQNYGKNFSFVPQYGEGVADLLERKDVHLLLDLGCGDGTLTARFAKEGMNVTGLDSSEEMLERARKSHPTIQFVKADACHFSVAQQQDAVFSNAVLHWIDKEQQPAMLACVAKALRPGGQFVFEMGGAGNNALIHGALQKAFSRRGLSYVMPFYFPSIGEYAPLVEQAGLQVTSAFLFARPTKFEGEDGLKNWIHMFVNRPFAGVSDAVREEITDEVQEALRPVLFRETAWYLDYVRLRMRAVRKNLAG
ncbi:MAG: class I SAM-dependent methyltransferase [Lachnospiraceae bacterium]